MARTLLTAARAQRAARQYFGLPCTAVPSRVPGVYCFYCAEEGRLVVLSQPELGLFTVKEHHTQDLEEPMWGPVEFQATYTLPTIGPINFNGPHAPK